MNPDEKTISQLALASRLSYFLWSSMPDEELLALADQGRLSDPANSPRNKSERLLKDPKAGAFMENFTGPMAGFAGHRLHLAGRETCIPNSMSCLRISMIEEPHRFFREVLENDLSLMNFVDSDFTFLNERLAKHYGIPGVKGQDIPQGAIPKDSVRGGVLTQASVLKVTANGTNTSPVIRGAWVMENILGRSVPPPPANVPAVEPDIRGATTLREQLAKHSNVESCAVCHNQIDPPGFALENFDVIGGWRENYRTLGEGKRPEFSQHPLTFAWIRYRIGLAGRCHRQPRLDGKSFQDIREFKDILINDQRSITGGLAKKLADLCVGPAVGIFRSAARSNALSITSPGRTTAFGR